MNSARAVLVIASLLSLVMLIACGGGGGGSSSSSPISQSQTLTITTASPLPGTLQGHSYSATLTATGGQAPYHWSIGSFDQTHLMQVDGLTLDPNTGVLSGTPTFIGTGQFLATVTDSSSPTRTATKSFTFWVATPLVVSGTQNVGVGQFDDVRITLTGVSGGVSPLKYTLDGACVPPGMKSNAANLTNGTSGIVIMGTAITPGTYQCRITIQDSFTPPEVGTTLMTIVVAPRPLSIVDCSLPSVLLLNRIFSGRVVALGGVPPYSYAKTSGSLPPGIGPLDANTGQLSGTPSATGFYMFTVRVTDSSPTPTTASQNFSITVSQAKGRNDSPATATPIGNQTTYAASISPYIDPPNGTPAAGDHDFYKLVSLGGATVQMETWAKRNTNSNPLDTVMEIVDGNGRQLSTCRLPGDTTTNFNSACINDDISSPPQHVQDSALDFRVPGAPNVATTFYVHVLDWRGDARPDMTYSLNVSGVVSPLTISTTSLKPAARGKPYEQFMGSTFGTGAVSWSVDSGTLPPGLTLSTDGSLRGAATTNGTYSFTVRATDSGNPPQATTKAMTIDVVDPLTITSPAIWPDACVNQPYTFAVQTSGGVPPFNFGFISARWVAINPQWVNGRITGVFSGTSNVTGTFTGHLTATDATPYIASQDVTLTVKACP